jgi:polar amino acid transport system substrate-binding protein
MRKILLALFIFVSLVNANNKDLIIIAEKDYPPITFKNKNGKADGLAVEVTKLIMKNLKLNQKIRVLPWNRAYNMLTQKPNVVLFSVSRTKQRENIFQWVGPIYNMKSNIYVKKDSTIKVNSLDDLKKLKSIGTYFNSFNEQYLKQKGFKNLKPIKNNILNIKKLMNNRVDAITATNVTIKEMLKKAGYSTKDVKDIFTFMNVGVYYAFSKGVPTEIIDAWNKEFKKLQDSGKLQQIRDKWLK